MRARNCLNALHVPFRQVNIDYDVNAEHFVTVINNGYRSTPTLVIGEGNLKLILTEPNDDELDRMLVYAGHLAQ